jgi:hypothetical protein
MRAEELTMNGLLAFCLGVLLALTPAAHAQPRPDLSGTWLPERGAESPAPAPPGPPAPPPPAPGLPPPPPPPTVVWLTIRQSDEELRVERTMTLGAEKAVYTFTFNLSGGENINHMGPIASKSTAAWKQDRLIITSTYFNGGKEVGRGIEVYALRDGKLLIEEERVVPAGRFTTRQVYSKGS